MLRLNDILDRVAAAHPEADLELIQKAYVFSAKVHQGQVRLSGEPYLDHPLEVAGILADMRLDEASVVTGLLHDTVEDTHATLQEIQAHFGAEIAQLVDGVTKISKITFSTSAERQAENFRKMILAMSKDIRVIMVKLADRLHNMRTLEYLPPDRQQKIAQETLDIYAPLANRLGMGWLKVELEDLALRYLKPEAYQELSDRVAKRRQARERYIQEVKQILTRELQRAGLEAEVSGRPKHFYSIYRKMLTQQLSFDQVYDLVAVRIILKSVKECYAALGIIHALWKPVPGRFKDYIAMPKANGYQSLHTTVIGPYGERVEIQIRSEEMHRVGEYGVAAHWRYKEGKGADEREGQQFAWLRQLLEWHRDLKDPGEFLETVKVDLFPDEVYVFTPKGEVKEFPRGATPVDFAYAIHTEVGHRCTGAKVNGKLVPLKSQLKNGDVIEILTSSHHKPSKDWLKFVKTSRARTKIRQFISVEEREQALTLGREILERECRRHGLDSAGLLRSGDLKAVAQERGLADVDGLLTALCYGRLSPTQVLGRFLPEEPRERARPEGRRARRSDGGPAIKIKGVGDVLVRLGRCCSPLPGDEVLGFITRGRGVTVHARECPKALEVDPERRVEVQWESGERTDRPAKIMVLCVDKKGILADMSASITAAQANISHAQVRTTHDQKAVCLFQVMVQDLDQLKAVMKSVERVKGVIKVERLRA
ncbi:MAG: bifunctional (p)ppGpp synthetase/guanosine-3',5'-bis(diphosphate) 3'-pyrophosphohydrolase [Deltaproteobacteria bacterium]|nr:bifunctional (p)ppGpp synthetase/guanosine-3',5'-bis(diphosphate) 3'-pyrophosphohydrolase [Deltaproteobacteria bacterium]